MRRSLRRADGQPRSPGEIPDLAGQISVIGTLTGFGIDNDSGCSSDTRVRPENPELCNAKFLRADCTTGDWSRRKHQKLPSSSSAAIPLI
jgi:hypothetical protein